MTKDDTSYPCIFLVIPNSDYHQKVPVLLGTNILSTIMKDFEKIYRKRYLQTAKLTTPWFSPFRCMLLRERELTKNNRLALVKSAEKNRIIIPPNTETYNKGNVD